MKTKKSSIEKMYEQLGESGHKSNLRLTVKVMKGAKEEFYYDLGAAFVEDPQRILSKTIVTGVYDVPREIHCNEGGERFVIVEKNFVDIVQPRFLEDFIAAYGKKNVSIYEAGKYVVHMDKINELLK